jgi:tripartite-type tricarboxylate transporter receptor subunit TctC
VLGRRRGRLPAAAAAVVMSLVLAACSSSGSEGTPGSSSASASPGSAAAGLAFFKGKTITYVIPNTPGSPPGLIMEAMKSGLEKYLGATINIEYNSNVATVGEDVVGTAKPDGLTLGDMALQVVLNEEYSGQGTPAFSLNDVSWVGATYAAPSGVFGCQESSFTSFGALVKSRTPLKIVEITTGSNDEMNRLLMAAWPVPHTFLTGYTTADVTAGCQRGDGNFSSSSLARALNASGTSVVAGLTPLLLTGPVPAGSPNAFLNSKVPTFAEYAKQNPPTTALGREAIALAISSFSSTAPNFTTFGPPGIPASRLAALTAAFTAVAAEPAVTKASLLAAIPPGFVAPATVTAFVKQQLQAKSLVQELSGS